MSLIAAKGPGIFAALPPSLFRKLSVKLEPKATPNLLFQRVLHGHVGHLTLTGKDGILRRGKPRPFPLVGNQPFQFSRIVSFSSTSGWGGLPVSGGDGLFFQLCKAGKHPLRWHTLDVDASTYARKSSLTCCAEGFEAIITIKFTST